MEGGQLTYGETKALLLFGITAQGKPLKDHLEVQGHDEAIHFIEDMIKQNYHINEVFIRDLHKLILKESYKKEARTAEGVSSMRTIHVGKYKETPNHVLTKTGEMFYFASPEETPAKMNDLMDWYKLKKEDKEIEPIVFAAEFHYRFIVIHPFDDGNGRMARLLMNFILMQYGLPPVVVRTEDKENYFIALQEADGGMLTPFVEYMAKGLLRSLEVMVKGAKGESIEEPNDFEKEIALLKQSLKQKNDKIESTLNEDTLKLWGEQTLPVILRQFVLMCEQFDGLYAQIVYYTFEYREVIDNNDVFGETIKAFHYRFNKHDILHNNTLNTIQKSLYLQILLNTKCIYLPISALFNTFTFNKKDSFDYNSELYIELTINNYIISCEKSNKKITKLYHQTPTEEELAYILDEEARLHLAFIKNQTVD